MLADTPGTPSPHQQQVDLLFIQQGDGTDDAASLGGDTAAIVINEVATNKRNTCRHPLLATILMVPKRQDIWIACDPDCWRQNKNRCLLRNRSTAFCVERHKEQNTQQRTSNSMRTTVFLGILYPPNVLRRVQKSHHMFSKNVRRVNGIREK